MTSPDLSCLTDTDASSYPGGYQAREIEVYLFADGRYSFSLTRHSTGATAPDWNGRAQLAREAKALRLVDVTGCDWPGIIARAERAADALRGCTWAAFCAGYRAELTPAGEQLVIPGCERVPPRQKGANQLELFG